MPHDYNGELIQVGDIVYLVGKVSQITTGEEFCNIMVDSTLPAKPAGAMASFWFNANQVTKSGEILKKSTTTSA